jgi:hypothetical protein
MDVGGEGHLPFLVADVFDRLEAGLVRGVVDQDVDAAEGLDRALDDGAAMRRIADVAGDQQRLAARLLDQPLGLGRVLILRQIGDHDISALAGKGNGDRAADAAVRAGDDCFLVGQLAMADIAVFAMIGTGSSPPSRRACPAAVLVGVGWGVRSWTVSPCPIQ